MVQIYRYSILINKWQFGISKACLGKKSVNSIHRLIVRNEEIKFVLLYSSLLTHAAAVTIQKFYFFRRHTPKCMFNWYSDLLCETSIQQLRILRIFVYVAQRNNPYTLQRELSILVSFQIVPGTISYPLPACQSRMPHWPKSWRTVAGNFYRQRNYLNCFYNTPTAPLSKTVIWWSHCSIFCLIRLSVTKNCLFSFIRHRFRPSGLRAGHWMTPEIFE